MLENDDLGDPPVTLSIMWAPVQGQAAIGCEGNCITYYPEYVWVKDPGYWRFPGDLFTYEFWDDDGERTVGGVEILAGSW